MRAGDNPDIHAAKSEFAPAVLLVEGTKKLVTGTAKERDLARIAARLIANERVNVSFPEASLLFGIRRKIDQRVHIDGAVTVATEKPLGSLDGGADFPTDELAPLRRCPGE